AGGVGAAGKRRHAVPVRVPERQASCPELGVAVPELGGEVAVEVAVHRPAEAGLHARHDEPAPEHGDDRTPGERERRGRRALLHAISPLTTTRSSAVSRWSGPMVKSAAPTPAPRSLRA